MRSRLESEARWFPELSRFEKLPERHRAWKKARGDLFRPRFFLYFLLATAIGGAALRLVVSFGIMPAVEQFVPRASLPSSLEAVIIGALVGWLGVTGALWFGRKTIQRSLRRQLNEAGLPTCMRCGYDLRGQTEPRCPECGEPFDPAMLDRNAQ